MANEEYLPSGSWTSLPPPQYPTGLLATPPAMTPYQKAMAEMQQSSSQLNSLLSSSGGYKPGIFKQRNPDELLSGLSNITDIRRGGYRNPAEQARIDAFFDAMTPQELAEFQAKNAEILNMVLGPGLLGDIMNFIKDGVQPAPTLKPATYTPPAQIANAMGGMGAYNPSIFSTSVSPQGKVNIGPITSNTMTEAQLAQADSEAQARAAANTGMVSTGGVSPSSGSPMGGIASTGTSGQAAAAVAAANAAAASGVGTGGVSTSSGSPMGGISSGGGSAASGGGGGGGGGGCCFIMLEARYGNGTMDRVVRRYRDEKITDRNKRGYYKLAEVFVPLMRKSKLFSFIVVKTFADPAVCYAKWYYGENKWGWIFKPLEKFWMSLFDTLGSDTKFIRENGETV